VFWGVTENPSPKRDSCVAGEPVVSKAPKASPTTDREESFRSVPTIPEAVFRTWTLRESVEWQAQEQFQLISQWLKIHVQDSPQLYLMAQQCGDEEMRHAELCRKLLALSPTPITLNAPEKLGLMGTQTQSGQEKVLYSATALSCITETLSTALLLEMSKTAAPGLFHSVIKEILEDEIGHSKIGWALLQHFGQSHSLSWLSEYVPEMLRTSFNLENSVSPTENLSSRGILKGKTVREIFFSTTNEVIIPGLKMFGIDVKKDWEKQWVG